MSEPILKIRNIESFYGPIMAIRGVSLDVHPGQIVSILGANGAGKTTLMKTVSGVMDPEKGKITFDGREIQGSEPHKVVQQGIVHVPEGREVFPLLTVNENLSLGAYTAKDKAQIEQDREMVFSYFPVLKERRTQEAGTLSGGQQQMLAIGRGLMASPKIMLLDEPSLGLSPASGAGDLRHPQTAERRTEHDDDAGRTERSCGAGTGPSWLCDGGRTHRHGRGCRHIAAIRGHPEFLSGVQEEGARENRRWKRKKTWR